MMQAVEKNVVSGGFHTPRGEGGGCSINTFIHLVIFLPALIELKDFYQFITSMEFITRLIPTAEL